MSQLSRAHQHTERSDSPCQVPRFKEPFVIGIDIVEPTRVALVCDTLYLSDLGAHKRTWVTYESLQADIALVRMVQTYARYGNLLTTFVSVHPLESLRDNIVQRHIHVYGVQGTQSCQNLRQVTENWHHLCEHLRASQIHWR